MRHQKQNSGNRFGHTQISTRTVSLNGNYQKPEPGNAVRLFDVDGTASGISDAFCLHAYDIARTFDKTVVAGRDDNKLPVKSIWWQGQEYKAWPCQTGGIETATDGTSARPTLPVVNLDSPITVLCLAYDDLPQAKVTIYDTLAQYLDVKNYSRDNSSADPQQEKLEVFYVDAKSAETNELMASTLPGSMDLQELMIPTRQLYSLCIRCVRNKYRSGDRYDYAGARCFDKHSNPVNDPSFDECPDTLTACRLRHGGGSELPFGGFPDTSLVRSWYAPESYRCHHGVCCC